eukprot:CAMPEP_0172690752 /NCGR_PEP_ID=MMETSP1074-20121228/24080_1 /TAXON_ID=2916 /ORGANISM="Ceratium fusus, Strain PA161109" /LENGTH=218 /DNA_ID=CAMNT_0013510735 /DNA_START=1 /DNA_END=654 /DNA_ORIENTATION=+
MGYTKQPSSAHKRYAAALLGACLFAFFLAQMRSVSVPQSVVDIDGLSSLTASSRRLTPKELGYDAKILQSNLLQPGVIFEQEAAATGLEFQFMAQGFNHDRALVLVLHNSNHDGGSLSVDLPAGMLFAPAQNRELQNLVLRDPVTVSLLPGETAHIEQWAYCGNQFHIPPLTEMKASGWVLNAPRCQHCVWQATAPYELPVSAVEGPWMASKLATAAG